MKSVVAHRKKCKRSGHLPESRKGESVFTLMSLTTRGYLYQYMVQGLTTKTSATKLQSCSGAIGEPL